ncbi:MAG: hypothetical protein ABJA80_04220 [bacterium]
MARLRTALAALLVVCGALAIAPASAHAQKRSRDLITREEIDASAQKDQDIYALIRVLRPHFLDKARGVRTLGNSSTRMGVYVDGVHETDFNSLKNILASTVEEVRYLDPSRAESEYGQESNGGAVVVRRLGTTPPAAVQRDTTKPPPR